MDRDREILVTIRPIKQGDQLFVSYLGFGKNTKKRQASLKNQYQFDCKCDKCEPQCKSIDRAPMKADTNFRYLLDCAEVNINDKAQRTEHKQKCIDFLHKYGHLPWSEELEYVLHCFKNCLSRDLIIS